LRLQRRVRQKKNPAEAGLLNGALPVSVAVIGTIIIASVAGKK
jgi:hypothetical protein